MADSMEVMVFEALGETYGTALDEVDEITMMMRIRPVHGMPDFVLGVVNLRGELIPVISMAERLGEPGDRNQYRTPWRNARIILTSIDSHRFGVIVDRIVGIETLDPDEQRDEAVGDVLPFIDHAWLHREHVILGASMNRLLSKAEVSHLSRAAEVS